MRGTRNRPSSAAGAIGEHLVAVEARPHVVGTEHVDERERVGGRRHAVGVERRDLGRVLEDHAELPVNSLDLVVGERETGELRDVLDVGARESSGIGASLGVRRKAANRLRYDAPVAKKYAFLSDEWFAEARAIVDEQRRRTSRARPASR